MEWNRIEEKWMEMTVRLQAGAHGAKQPGANTGGQGVETLPSAEDQGPASTEPNTPMTA